MKIWRFITGGKRRKAVATGLALLVIGGGVAVAYFLANATGSGTSSNQTLGSASTVTTPVAVSYTTPPANGLTPGASEPLNVNIQNPSSQAVGVSGIAFTVNTSNPSCNASWFSVDDSNYSGTISPNSSANVPATLSFNDSGGDQSACEAPTTVSVTATVS